MIAMLAKARQGAVWTWEAWRDVARAHPYLIMLTACLSLAGCLFVVVPEVERIAYVPPARAANSTVILQPFIRDGVLHVPADVTRTESCLSQTTVTMQKPGHDYGAPYGVRTDVSAIGVLVTPVTPVGLSRIMLLWPVPAWLPHGQMLYVPYGTDDCGGPLDESAKHPRPAVAREVEVP